jgi:DNA repair exonuclease SbcCD ATPase subunit
MKVAYVDLCGFRGYRKRLRIEFGDKFTVIDGRNGAGKSTIFDAIEFALTGTIGKYGDAKADRETIADYLWWKGEGPGPESRFVEVGFRDSDGAVSIRRTQFDAPDRCSPYGANGAAVRSKACSSVAPESALRYLHHTR